MPNIRVPESAQQLLPMCRKHELLPTERELPQCFETYADLLVFAAAYGFSQLHGSIPKRKTRFLSTPNPIDFEIFKSDRRFPPILLIALAASKDKDVVRDESLLCKLTEDYAAVGFEKMIKIQSEHGDTSFILQIANALVEQEDDRI
jgi:hypothetical protein